MKISLCSKTFYQQLRSSERQSLVGPPESMREHVVAAAKAMRCGNWSACAQFVVNKKMNTKVWDLFYEADRVRDMLTKFIKEESLRTYLFTYSNVYSSISMPSLADMFDLVLPKVHSVISKMIINEELMASLDDPTDTVVMHRSEPSRLQALSMQLADKVTNLVDANERIFEVKQGNNFYQRGNQLKNFVSIFFLYIQTFSIKTKTIQIEKKLKKIFLIYRTSKNNNNVEIIATKTTINKVATIVVIKIIKAGTRPVVVTIETTITTINFPITTKSRFISLFFVSIFHNSGVIIH